MRNKSQVRIYGICGVQSCTAAGFLEERQFFLPTAIPPAAPYALIIDSV
jgi:hypothetical protein